MNETTKVESEAELAALVDETAERFGMPRPAVEFEGGGVGGAATRRHVFDRRGVLILERGLVGMSRWIARAVVAHELGHLKMHHYERASAHAFVPVLAIALAFFAIDRVVASGAETSVLLAATCVVSACVFVVRLHRSMNLRGSIHLRFEAEADLVAIENGVPEIVGLRMFDGDPDLEIWHRAVISEVGRMAERKGLRAAVDAEVERATRALLLARVECERGATPDEGAGFEDFAAAGEGEAGK